MVSTRASVPEMAKHRIWVATSPGLATLLLSHNACEEEAGYLAAVTHRHKAI
jgi:hypothetical protein